MEGTIRVKLLIRRAGAERLYDEAHACDKYLRARFVRNLLRLAREGECAGPVAPGHLPPAPADDILVQLHFSLDDPAHETLAACAPRDRASVLRGQLLSYYSGAAAARAAVHAVSQVAPAATVEHTCDTPEPPGPSAHDDIVADMLGALMED